MGWVTIYGYTGITSWYITSHLGHPSEGMHNEYWKSLGKKRRGLRNSSP